MLPDKRPQRTGPKRKWVILLSVTLLLLLAAAVLAFFQRETLSYILHPDSITLKSAGEIRAALGAEADGGPISYTTLEGAVRVSVFFEGDRLSRLEAAFNVYDVPVSSIGDALGKAETVLSPYLTPPEIKALCFLLTGELPGYVSHGSIDYSLGLGSHTLSVLGTVDIGDMAVRVALKEDFP